MLGKTRLTYGLSADHRHKARALCAAESRRASAAGGGRIGCENIEIACYLHIYEFHTVFPFFITVFT